MVLSIVVALMVLLLTAFWTVQGLLSAVLMFFDALVACMLAFGFYEALDSTWTGSDTMNAIGKPLALMGIFLVSLAVLRYATDKFVPNNIRIPLQLERAGGGVFGFLTGMILTGTACVALQMFPMGSSIFGFERFKDVGDRPAETRALGFFSPDGFTVGLVNMLSSGSFSGSQPFSKAHPEFLLDLYAARATPQPGNRVILPANAVSIEAFWNERQIDHVAQTIQSNGLGRQFTTEDAMTGSKFLICRVDVSDSAAEKDQPQIRFRMPQFRVFGTTPPDEQREMYLAAGGSDLYIHSALGYAEIKADQPRRLIRFSPLTNILLDQSVAKAVRHGSGYRFDVAFEVPETFKPEYIEFKRGAIARLTPSLFKEMPPGPLPMPQAETPEVSDSSEAEVGEALKGVRHVANAVEERTGVSPLLPIPLDADNSYVKSKLLQGKLNEAHIWVEVPDDPDKIEKKITEFYVPKGKVIVQIGAEKTIPASLIGRAMNYSANVVSYISLTTSDGTVYYAQGVYSAAPIGGKMFFEIQYWPTAEVPERCLQARKPLKLTNNVMERANPAERKFGYIFLVDPGVEIVQFSTGGSESQAVKISVPQ